MQEWYTCTGGERVEKGRVCRYCGARPTGDECRGPLPSSQWAPSGSELEPYRQERAKALSELAEPDAKFI
jgi:hypothetical protein